jgi:hypothetical protein
MNKMSFGRTKVKIKGAKSKLTSGLKNCPNQRVELACKGKVGTNVYQRRANYGEEYRYRERLPDMIKLGIVRAISQLAKSPTKIPMWDNTIKGLHLEK